MIDLLDDAIYRTIHDAPGGALGLAPRIGMNPGTLNNKAYPGHDAQVNLRESVPIQLATRDFQILHAYCHLLEHAAIPLGDFSGTSDGELMDLYCQYHADLGETAQAIRDALNSDCRRITRSNVRRVRRELIDDMQAGMEFLARLDDLAEDDDDE